MTRFLYIADTHLGAAPPGFQQQPAYPEKLKKILSALRAYIAASGPIDFVLHGGDMIDATTDQNIRAADLAFDLAVPVYLCLGNHDLTTPDAVDQWRTFAPRFFGNRSPDYPITTDDCVIHIAPNQWGAVPYYWKSAQDPNFSVEQTEALTRDARIAPNLPHLLVTHSPVYGLPPEQTGFDTPFHAPPAPFTSQVREILNQNKKIGCVLGAHNHLNMRVKHKGAEFVTVSALVETPFEFKLFEVTPDKIVMSTHSLRAQLDNPGDYDPAKAFVQGRDTDRTAVIFLTGKDMKMAELGIG